MSASVTHGLRAGRKANRLSFWTGIAIGALILFLFGGLVDKILRRDTIDRRASRMLATFQRVGGTLVKIGQQLSMRLDMLPYAYCRELMKLLDAVKPFKTEYAIRAVERVTGRPLAEVFSTFDPVPIGSASIGHSNSMGHNRSLRCADTSRTCPEGTSNASAARIGPRSKSRSG